MNFHYNLLAANGTDTQSIITMVLIYGAVFAAVYFFFIRPGQKKKKAEAELRNSLEIGDDITTIGGIMGRVVSIKEDTDSIIIETSTDRTKIRLKRWAISTVDTEKAPVAKETSKKDKKEK
ncbi:MAG: preprotein translocase subunit YajC [Bacillota bacterium]|nr:preprotein translocase subunit YajC [Bacillota bacterium]